MHRGRGSVPSTNRIAGPGDRKSRPAVPPGEGPPWAGTQQSNPRKSDPVAAVRTRAIRSPLVRLDEVSREEDKRIRVAIVVPAHNEGASIGSLLAGLPKDTSEVRYRTFVCDDGSTDGTGTVAASAGAVVFRHSRNLGIGAALTTGLEGARAWNPHVFVQIDADGQHDPALIPLLLEPILRGQADYVIGSRFMGGASGLAPVRRAGVRFYSRLVGILTGLPITDVTSGFRAFRSDAFESLTIQSQKNWAVEVTLRAGLNHLRTVEIPAPFRPRMGGNSQFDFRWLFLVYHYRAIQQVFRAYTAPRSRRLGDGHIPGVPSGHVTPARGDP